MLDWPRVWIYLPGARTETSILALLLRDIGSEDVGLDGGSQWEC